MHSAKPDATPTASFAGVQTVILVGGLGTRLRPVLPDTAKPLALVNGVPFLSHLLECLTAHGIGNITLAAGHGADQFVPFLNSMGAFGAAVGISVEPTPLGTGGALRLAVEARPQQTVLAMNGDSLVDLDFAAFLADFERHPEPASLAVYPMDDCRRFGRVHLDAGGLVERFEEKSAESGPGLINAGVYLFEREIITAHPLDTILSIEHHILPNLTDGRLRAFPARGRFVDIGTPESYAAAAQALMSSRP